MIQSVCLKKTAFRLCAIGPFFLFSLLLFNSLNGAITQKGAKERSDMVMVALMTMGITIWGMMHVMKNFFVESNKAAFEKFKKKKETVTTMYAKSSAASTTDVEESGGESPKGEKGEIKGNQIAPA